MMRLFIVGGLSIVAIAGAQNTDPLTTPVVVIPGYGASKIQAKLDRPSNYKSVNAFCDEKSDWYTLWFQGTSLLPAAVNCWNDVIKLRYNSATSDWENNIGVTTRVQNFGKMDSVLFIDDLNLTPIMKTLSDSLEDAGLVRDLSVRGAPYDWRYVADAAFVSNLKQLVEDAYNENGKRKVALLSFSMGGRMALYFIHSMSQSWLDKYVAVWIPVATSWAGCPCDVKMLTSGDNFVNPAASKIMMRENQRTFQSMTWLMPDPNFYGNEVIASINGVDYTPNNYEAFFNAIGFPLGYASYQRHKTLSNDFRTPGVNVVALHSRGLQTPSKYIWKDSNINVEPSVEYVDGDSMLPLVSLTAIYSKWKTGVAGTKYTFETKEFLNIEHMKMVSHPDVMKEVVNILRKYNAPPSNGCATKLTTKTYTSQCLWWYTQFRCNAGDVKTTTAKCGVFGTQHTCVNTYCATFNRAVGQFNVDETPITPEDIYDTPMPFVFMIIGGVTGLIALIVIGVVVNRRLKRTTSSGESVNTSAELTKV